MIKQFLLFPVLLCAQFHVRAAEQSSPPDQPATEESDQFRAFEAFEDYGPTERIFQALDQIDKKLTLQALAQHQSLQILTKKVFLLQQNIQDLLVSHAAVRADLLTLMAVTNKLCETIHALNSPPLSRSSSRHNVPAIRLVVPSPSSTAISEDGENSPTHDKDSPPSKTSPTKNILGTRTPQLPLVHRNDDDDGIPPRSHSDSEILGLPRNKLKDQR